MVVRIKSLVDRWPSMCAKMRVAGIMWVLGTVESANRRPRHAWQPQACNAYIHGAESRSSLKCSVAIDMVIMSVKKLNLIHASFISLLFILALTQIGLQVNIRQDFSNYSSISTSWPPIGGPNMLSLVPKNVVTAPSALLLVSAALVVAAVVFAALYCVAHWSPVC